MSELIEIPLALSHNQALKLKRGNQIQLHHKQLTHNHNVVLKLHPAHVKRIDDALRRKKGLRLQLSQGEVQASGLFDWLRDAGNWVKKNVIQTDAYQKFAKPLVKNLVDRGATALKAVVGNDDINNAIDKGVNYVGQQTGAYGLGSNLLSTSHPAYNPPVSLPPPGVKPRSHTTAKKGVRRGGSFMLA
jgi:hypothetical protein